MKANCLAIVCTLLLVGCAPIPHMEYRAPKIIGTLKKDGLPLVHKKVYLSARSIDKNCKKFNVEAKTNGSGRFEIGPVKEFLFLYWFIGDPVAFWDLCVEDGEIRRQFLGQGGRFTPAELRVECELSRDKDLHLDTLSEAYHHILGKCHLTD